MVLFIRVWWEREREKNDDFCRQIFAKDNRRDNLDREHM